MNSSFFTKYHTFTRQYQVKRQNSPVSDCYVAPNAQYSKSQNMCNILQHIVLDLIYCQILHPPLMFTISPLDNFCTVF